MPDKVRREAKKWYIMSEVVQPATYSTLKWPVDPLWPADLLLAVSYLHIHLVLDASFLPASTQFEPD